MWPDALCVAADGYLYVTANGFDGQTRFHAGRDIRLKPYSLFRVRIDAQPVLLRSQSPRRRPTRPRALITPVT
jgi:hypothetical protein